MVGKYTPYPNSVRPNKLDIVWCRFPDSELLKPSPKPRPALVRQVLHNPKTGEIAVEVAYGTSNLKLDQDIPLQLIVDDQRDLDDAGLVKPTRFDLALTKKLPWCKEFFTEIRRGDGPIIGRLSAHSLFELNQVVEQAKPKLLAAPAKHTDGHAIIVEPTQEKETPSSAPRPPSNGDGAGIPAQKEG